jgi:nicotinamide phosphoribosyltransferase
MRTFPVPEPCSVDAYQAGHYLMVPPGMENFELSQAVFRRPLDGLPGEAADHRLLSGGIAPFLLLEPGFARPLERGELVEAEAFFSDFYAGRQPFPWPRAMFDKILNQHAGYYPLCVTGLFDGQAHYVGEPCLQIWTDVAGCGECVGWIESTLLPYLWNFSICASRGRRRKQRMIDVFRRAFPSRSLEQLHEMVAPRLHDFGRRGGAVSQMTGIAHLYNWLGTDTVDAAYAAVRYLNDGRPFGACSVLASAHRSTTPWTTEDAAYDRIVELFDRYRVISVVADTYGYARGIRKLAQRANAIRSRGGWLVARPDSGDPVETTLLGLRELEQALGSDRQESGLKTIRGASIIQGDTMSDALIFDQIYPAVMAAGFCPSNVAFGMGEQSHRAHRSETELAYKTALVGIDDPHFPTGYRENMKSSDTLLKRSIPGAVGVDCRRRTDRVYPISIEQLRRGETGDLVVLHDHRPNPLPVRRELFSQTRERAWRSWLELPPGTPDSFDPALRHKQEDYLATMTAD